MSVAAALLSAACTVTSPAHTVALVELYTSQGCSSCPPADRWLSALPSSVPPDRAIPLALHVGYWDYIGWKDPFARREFNARHSELAAANRNRSVYTPGVFLQGRETPDWRDTRAFKAAVQAINATAPRATLSLAARIDEGAVEVTVDAKGALHQPRIALALAQSGFATAVTAGENRGAKLANDYVARAWQSTSGANASARFALPADVPAAQLDLIAWVQDGAAPAPLQAVRLPLARCRRE
jgi:hypothetical protein